MICVLRIARILSLSKWNICAIGAKLMKFSRKVEVERLCRSCMRDDSQNEVSGRDWQEFGCHDSFSDLVKIGRVTTAPTGLVF